MLPEKLDAEVTVWLGVTKDDRFRLDAGCEARRWYTFDGDYDVQLAVDHCTCLSEVLVTNSSIDLLQQLIRYLSMGIVYPEGINEAPCNDVPQRKTSRSELLSD
jgi:hypothetical protein